MQGWGRFPQPEDIGPRDPGRVAHPSPMRPSRLSSDIVAAMQRNLGLVTRQQLLTRHRVPPRRVDWWLEHNVLKAVHRAIYRRAGGYIPQDQDLLAAIWFCGSGAVAGPRPSLRLLSGIPIKDADVEVVLAVPRHVRPKPFTVRSITMTDRDRGMVNGVPVLQPPRALIDLAAALPDERLRGLIDDLRRCRAMQLGALHTRCLEMPGQFGARRLLRVLGTPQMQQENEGERGLARLLARFHPQPQWQTTTLVPGRRLDACWPEALYGLEFDGRDHHVLPTDRDNDGFRDMDTTDGHVLTQRITSGMIRRDPSRVLSHIRATYERRLREVGVLADSGLLPPRLLAFVRNPSDALTTTSSGW